MHLQWGGGRLFAASKNKKSKNLSHGCKEVSQWSFDMRVQKVLLPPPKNLDLWPKTGIFGHAGLFSALLVGRLVVVARRLYLARHLFTLFVLHLLFIKVFYLCKDGSSRPLGGACQETSEH